MAAPISKRLPIQDVASMCYKCSKVNFEETDIVKVDEYRTICANCRDIYKYDSNRQGQKFKGKGRVSKLDERYGAAIKNLVLEGKGQRDIAGILGISPTTVNKYCKENGLIKPLQLRLKL